MDKSLVPVTSNKTIAAIADQVAGRHALADYQARKSEETRRRQRFDLEVFARFLTSAGYQAGDLYTDLEAWSSISYGLVSSFVRWLEREGYAIGSINVRLSTVRAYASLAARAGFLSGNSLALIKAVKGYQRKEGRNIDEHRETTRRETAKKAAPVEFAPAHATLLKQHALNARGKNAARDFLIICLLLDHGLRCEEVAALNRSDLNLQAATLTFYRHKVDLEQTHNLTAHSLQAAQAYIATLEDQDQAAPLFPGIVHSREVKAAKSARRQRDRRIAERTIAHLVERLGRSVGLENLSPHDCRHYWATWAIRSGTDVKALQDAGGWASPAMPLKYAARAHIANENVKLPATTL